MCANQDILFKYNENDINNKNKNNVEVDKNINQNQVDLNICKLDELMFMCNFLVQRYKVFFICSTFRNSSESFRQTYNENMKAINLINSFVTVLFGVLAYNILNYNGLGFNVGNWVIICVNSVFYFM